MNIRSLVPLLSMAVLIASTPLHAQAQRKVPTLAELTSGSPDQLRPETIRGLQWFGKDYIYIDSEGLMHAEVGGAKAPKLLMSQSELLSLLGEDAKAHPAKFFLPFQLVGKDKGLLQLTYAKKHYVLDLKRRQLVSTFDQDTKGEQAFLLDPTAKHAAVVKGNNVYLAAGGQLKQLTTDGSPTIAYGQTVHQNEFGISGGLFWSPDGEYLAFYRMDQQMIVPYPLVHINARKATRQDLYYPMAGMPSHEVTLGVYELKTGKLSYMKTGMPRDKYLTNISWAPDSKELYIAEVNREQTRMELKAYAPSSGEPLRTLFVEENAKYIEPQHPLRFVPGRPKEFIWQSRRDGYMHLYRYTTEGKLLGQITRGDWEVVDFLGFADGGETLVYSSTQQSPTNRNVYRIGLDGQRQTLLTLELGWHQAQLSPDGSYLIDTFESLKDMRQWRIVSVKTGKRVKQLKTSVDPEADYQMPEITMGMITAADGKTPLHYKLIKPLGFDPKKKYPTIVYVYNGPHAQLVQNRWHAGSAGWDLYMATLGYAVFTVDGRGSAARGADFEQVIHRQLGVNEMADQMKGVEFLKSQPWVDADRLGVYGWSYGGFMTTNLMLTHPETFKVGVAGGAVIDWSRYEVMYGERYMDSPQENPEGYKAANLALRAGDLKGRLLLIHGTIDPVVVWQHTQLFVEACVKAGTYPDYMIYPEHEHNVRGRDRVHLNETITRYFRDHL